MWERKLDLARCVKDTMIWSWVAQYLVQKFTNDMIGACYEHNINLILRQKYAVVLLHIWHNITESTRLWRRWSGCATSTPRSTSPVTDCVPRLSATMYRIQSQDFSKSMAPEGSSHPSANLPSCAQLSNIRASHW